MNVVKTPQSVNAQCGDKGGSRGRKSGYSKSSTGRNQGKLHITGSRRYVGHSVKQGR